MSEETTIENYIQTDRLRNERRMEYQKFKDALDDPNDFNYIRAGEMAASVMFEEKPEDFEIDLLRAAIDKIITGDAIVARKVLSRAESSFEKKPARPGAEMLNDALVGISTAPEVSQPERQRALKLHEYHALLQGNK